MLAAQAHFPVYRNRSEVPAGSLVIGRNSVLPYYLELQQDLEHNGSKMLISYAEHCCTANVQYQAHFLGDLTFKTWPFNDYIRSGHDGPVVLKGATNSKKRLWPTHMFAQDRKQAIQTMLRLQEDDLISSQGIYVREYVPLVEYGVNPVGMPITEEYRFFMYCEHVLDRSYYWSSNLEDIDVKPDPWSVPGWFIEQATDRLRDEFTAYVMDIARDKTGRWWVVELNDLQMSGLSECSPNLIYGNLRHFVDKDLIRGKK